MDRVRSLRKILTRPGLANLCVHGTSPASFGTCSASFANFEATSFSELMRYWHLFVQFCIDFHTVTKRSEMTQNMSFGSNGVDRVRSLRKIPTRLCLVNLCDNGTSSASFASIFVQ
jgi:hypothetical protein